MAPATIVTKPGAALRNQDRVPGGSRGCSAGFACLDPDPAPAASRNWRLARHNPGPDALYGMAALPGRAGDDQITGEQAALRRVATLVARAAAPEDVLAAVTEEAGRLPGAHYATMAQYDPDGTRMIVAAWAAPAPATPAAGQDSAAERAHDGVPDGAGGADRRLRRRLGPNRRARPGVWLPARPAQAPPCRSHFPSSPARQSCRPKPPTRPGGAGRGLAADPGRRFDRPEAAQRAEPDPSAPDRDVFVITTVAGCTAARS